MAIPLASKTNVVAPDPTYYPYGNIRNDAPGTPGTPVNVAVYADFHQFFERLMDIADVTHNGLPDNASNGFQLFEALEKLAGSGAWTSGGSLSLTPNTGTASVINLHYNKFKKAGKTITWEVNAAIETTGSPTSIKVAFPTSVTPLGVAIGKRRFGWYLDGIMFVEIVSDGVILTRSTSSPFSSSAYQYNFEVSFEIA